MKNAFIFTIVFFLICFTNCNKDIDNGIDPNLLLNVKWHLDSVHIKALNSRVNELNFDQVLYPTECEKDNYFVFQNKLVISYYGTLKCSNLDPDSLADTWKLQSSTLYLNKKLYFVALLQSKKMELSRDTSYVLIKSGVQVKSDQHFLYFYSSFK